MQLSSRFLQALKYAVELHRDQRRKISGAPYVSHLFGVADLVLQYGGDEDEVIAALLHDAIEDQGGAPVREQLQLRFGPRVAEIVDGCTDADTTPKPPWQQRKDAYIERLRTASASVRLVSAADKLHNVRSLLADFRRYGESVWKHFHGRRDGTLWYFRSAVEALKAAEATPLVKELDLAIAELERIAG